MPSLLDSSSMGSYVWKNDFDEYMRLELGQVERMEGTVHTLFWSEGQKLRGHSLMMNFERDVTFQGLKVTRSDFW